MSDSTETIEEARIRDLRLIQEGAKEAQEEEHSEHSFREEMIELSQEVGGAIGCSRLEAAARALRFVSKGLDNWPMLMGDGTTVSTALEIEDMNYPTADSVLRVAFDLGDYGFTLDDLIQCVGPELVVRPKAYKNQISRLLRENGFFRKQVRRGGDRPLAWFHPKRCGISV